MLQAPVSEEIFLRAIHVAAWIWVVWVFFSVRGVTFAPPPRLRYEFRVVVNHRDCGSHHPEIEQPIVCHAQPDCPRLQEKLDAILLVRLCGLHVEMLFWLCGIFGDVHGCLEKSF